jgi:3-dehydroquinate dehydratase-2
MRIAQRKMMARFLVINGPNLNILGRRSQDFYGSKTLPDIEGEISRKAKVLEVEVDYFQANGEGLIIDYIQSNSAGAQGIIINPGALTHYGYSLRDALVDTRLPVVEVHLSNIHAREEWRRRSVISDIARGQIAGLGWRGYVAALEILAALVEEDK